jgi:hypothetical protein
MTHLMITLCCLLCNDAESVESIRTYHSIYDAEYAVLSNGLMRVHLVIWGWHDLMA